MSSLGTQDSPFRGENSKKRFTSSTRSQRGSGAFRIYAQPSLPRHSFIRERRSILGWDPNTSNIFLAFSLGLASSELSWALSKDSLNSIPASLSQLRFAK